MLDYFFPNLLIGLREGLEAALVVSILVAYLVKTDRRNRLPVVWAGVAAAVVLSVAFGALLTYVITGLDTFKQQELAGGFLSIIAVGLVTWMIFWMRRTARHLKAELTGKLEAAIAMGAGAVALMAFLAVAREGLETTLFFFSAAQQADSQLGPLLGFLVGIAIAVALAFALYQGAVRINLGTFFTWTGALLVVVAAGIFSYGIHDLQEAEVLPGLNTLAFDVSAQIPPDSWYATLLKGIFNFQPQTTVLQAIAWTAYLVPVLTFFLWPTRESAAPPAAPEESATRAGI
ncbi:iron uptake transporter permease EfeU [Cryptosporangium aurantiacum]|uniref:High-affinity iron transporter n=1 Tax=Cryptosporangium aurantiacum TaxID=134849 RepID=A0A1M7QUV3_9ACTN|nr:iron uptake transporter permease EfeU [Cryptosporangium aurantiacum]SHN35365.1 high-affinity iron transporter [Cryptosporangium aurantiacum]